MKRVANRLSKHANLLCVGLLVVLVIVAGSVLFVQALTNPQRVLATNTQASKEAQIVNGLLLELRSVVNTDNKVAVDVCFPFPAKKAGGYILRDVLLEVNGQTIENYTSSLSELRFADGSNLTAQAFVAAQPSNDLESKGRAIGRCDTLIFTGLNTSDLTKATLRIGSLRNDLPESFNCDDVQRALSEHNLAVEIICTPPSQFQSFHYTIKNPDGRLDVTQLEKQIDDAITDYRAGPWVFEIALH